MNEIISAKEIEAARRIVSRYLQPTPLRYYPTLSYAVGCPLEVWVKHENHQPTNAFKVRNSLVALSLTMELGARDSVITASTGSHGLGLAWAGQKLGVPVTVYVPETTSVEKIAAISSFDAQVKVIPGTYDNALSQARSESIELRAELIEATNNRGVIAGASTVVLEILDQLPTINAIVLAIGGGSLAAGTISALASLGRSDIAVYGVQAERAPAIHNSWHARQPLSFPPSSTLADSLATDKPYDATFPILLAGLSSFLLVTESEIIEAVRELILETHNLVEPGGAVGFAGLKRARNLIQNLQVCIVNTGSNINLKTLGKIIDA